MLEDRTAQDGEGEEEEEEEEELTLTTPTISINEDEQGDELGNGEEGNTGRSGTSPISPISEPRGGHPMARESLTEVNPSSEGQLCILFGPAFICYCPTPFHIDVCLSDKSPLGVGECSRRWVDPTVAEKRKQMDGALFLQSSKRHLARVKEEEGRTPTFWRQLHGPVIHLETINLISDDEEQAEG